MALEPNVAAGWIYAKLTGSAALTALVGGAVAPRITDAPAPQGQASPYVTYQNQTGLPLRVVGGIRIWSNLTYLVWGTMQTRSYAGTLGQIAEAIDDALDDQAGVVASGEVYVCRLVEHRQQVDPDESSWRSYGGLYRIYAKAS